MDEELTETIDIFGNLVPSFGLCHAKIYCSLKNGEPKTARQISEETGLVMNKAYTALKDLLEYGVVMCSGVNPANYHIKDPNNCINRFLKRAITQLKSKRVRLKKLNCSGNGDAGREYLIKIKGTQTRIIDYKNQAQVNDKDEARQIKKMLDKFVDDLEHK